jgi:hypothetical protein
MGLLDILMFAIFPMMIVEGEGGAAEVEKRAEENTEVEKEVTKPDDKKPVSIEQQMLDGIKTALKPEDPEEKKKKEVEAAAAATLAEANKGKTPEQIEQERVAAEAKKADDQKKADEEKLKGKKADDFQLTEEEKKVWKQETQRRFTELRGFAKAQQLEVERLSQENLALSSARENMMSVFDEAKVEPEELSQLLEYNKMVKTGNLQGALKVINEQRVAILKAMGKEEPGVDLLDDFPDLKGKVTENEMSRESALELANSRRRAAQDEQNRNAQAERDRQDQSGVRARETALAEIDRWCKEAAKGDIDYKAKETKIMLKKGDEPSLLDGILRDYPPNLWLPTLRRLFSTIEVVKPALPGNGNGEPLRPSGAKPGAKVFTELTPDALRAGLGYPPH